MSALGSLLTCCPVVLNALLAQRVPLRVDKASSLLNFPNLAHPLPFPLIHLPAMVTVVTLPGLGKSACPW